MDHGYSTVPGRAYSRRHRFVVVTDEGMTGVAEVTPINRLFP